MTTHDELRLVLAKHRAGDVIGLDHRIPLSYQMDVDYCQATLDVIKKHGAPWEALKATPNLWQQLPDSTGVYMFLFESQFSFRSTADTLFQQHCILYVGRAGDHESTNTLKSRYKTEYRKYIGGDPEFLWGKNKVISRSDRLKKYLTIYPLQYWYTVIEDRSHIEHIESQLINLINPPLNLQGRPRLRAEPPVPAFRSY